MFYCHALSFGRVNSRESRFSLLVCHLKCVLVRVSRESLAPVYFKLSSPHCAQLKYILNAPQEDRRLLSNHDKPTSRRKSLLGNTKSVSRSVVSQPLIRRQVQLRYCALENQDVPSCKYFLTGWGSVPTRWNRREIPSPRMFESQCRQ